MEPASLPFRRGDILQRDEPTPFAVENADGASPLVLLCDHAGRRVPRAIDLGVSPADMNRHIAWDIGAEGVARRLSASLDASLVLQPYSRLVIDCNRDPARADACPEVSDGTLIPANIGLAAQAKQARIDGVHEPYHARIAALLDAREAAGRPTRLVLVHSFTPVMAGFRRPWRYGVLHTGQPFALAVLAALREQPELGEIGDNAPYAMDEQDYTAFRHGRDRGIDFAELEIRQDLIADAAGQAEVADLLAGVLARVEARLTTAGPGSPPPRT